MTTPCCFAFRIDQLVFDGVADVISQYFRIEHEEPVRLLFNTLTEGRIDTFPQPGATLLEPWYHDSADSYERLESTLQSIRRYAVVKVIPAQNGGFWIDVAVYKELENMAPTGTRYGGLGHLPQRRLGPSLQHSASRNGNADSTQPVRIPNQPVVNPDPNAGLEYRSPAHRRRPELDSPRPRYAGRAADSRSDPRPLHPRRNAGSGELIGQLG